jgi:hypothetical protein
MACGEMSGKLSMVRACAIAALLAGLAPVLFYAAPSHSSRRARLGQLTTENSGGKYETFRCERFGVTFEYKAGWKLAPVHPFVPPGAASDSIPVVATYRLVPPSPPGSSDGRPYSYQYYVFFVRTGFVNAAHALGFNRNSQGEWTYKDAGISSKAVRVSNNGWQGLRMTYAFRLYNAPNAQQRAQGLALGNGYLGMSEGEKTLISPGGDLSIVLEFDPDIDTDTVRNVIIKSLRFFKPVTVQVQPQTKHK